ncbi:hypothetical protein C7212DRAFT_337076, partial [Tuber magnatum]
ALLHLVCLYHPSTPGAFSTTTTTTIITTTISPPVSLPPPQFSPPSSIIPSSLPLKLPLWCHHGSSVIYI